jgi:peptidoglycan/LPS O-acetylase OafA/YrhL
VSRVASLDFVRGFAALIVAVPHFFTYNRVATESFEAISIVGVEIFFVLSGYVLAPQILMCATRPSETPIFLARRWMRTIPAYIVALVCISILFGKFGSGDFFRYLFYVQNLVVQSNESDYFFVAWSLSVEEWFYVLFPMWVLGGAVLLKSSRYATLVMIAIAFIVAVTLARTMFADLSSWGPNARRVVLYRVDSIAYGFLLYTLIHKVAPQRVACITTPAAVAIVLCAAALAYWNAIAITSDAANFAKQVFPFLAALLGSSLIFLAVKTERMISRRARLVTLAVLGGQISYSVYLFHIIFLLTLTPSMKSLPLTVQFLIYLSSIIVFACIFYFYFEKPILSARPQFHGIAESKRTHDVPKLSEV